MTYPVPCSACRDGEDLAFTFTMAFQPIVDLAHAKVWAYEALVRGEDGQGAAAILAQVNDSNRYRFDQACRVRAIELASHLFGHQDDVRLSINFMPNAVYEPAACIKASLAAAKRVNFPRSRIMFEFTENERFSDIVHLKRILNEYRRHGFVTAIDDFGAGYSGLTLLADLQTDVIKLDMDLIRGIDASPTRQLIVQSVIGMARSLGITLIAEGVETLAEAVVLKSLGVTLFQGYLFARPTIASLPLARLDLVDAAKASASYPAPAAA